MDKLIKRLVKYKKKSGKSYESIGREMNIASHTIYRWAKGIRTPTGIYKTTLEQYLEVRGA